MGAVGKPVQHATIRFGHSFACCGPEWVGLLPIAKPTLAIDTATSATGQLQTFTRPTPSDMLRTDSAYGI